MRQIALCFSFLAIVSFGAVDVFAHAGEVHNYMGTVTALHDDGSFILTKTDGKTMHVHVSERTKYVHADGLPAKPAQMAGRRVVVTISKDGKTASTIKLGAVKQSEKK